MRGESFTAAARASMVADLQTIANSGQLTPSITYEYHPRTMTFPDGGLVFGANGAVTFKQKNGTVLSYPGAVPAPLALPAVDPAKHVNFYVHQYDFDALLWGFFMDGDLTMRVTRGMLVDGEPLETDTYQDTPRETCGADRSNAARRRSAKGRWPSRWSIGASPNSVTSDMSAPSTMGVPSEHHTSDPRPDAIAEFAQLATDARIGAAAAALKGNGISSLIVDSGEQARAVVRSILPVGAEVFNNTSRTLEAIGVAEDIERSGQYQPLRPRLYQMDREMQTREIRQLGAAPDFVVGSVHAVTEDGSLLIASASGSQLGPLVSGAGHVIFATAERPNLRWVADITEFPTGEGKLHLAAIRDLCHRGIVGWSMDEHQDAQLVVDALTMALGRTAPDPDGLIHHSDKGSPVHVARLRHGRRPRRTPAVVRLDR